MKAGAALLLLAMTLQAPRTRSIEGVVVDAVTKQPLANATVSVVPGNTGPLTDASGHFRVDAVQLGRQQLRVRAAGYTAREITLDITSEESRAFTFHLERPTGVVTGQVIDSRGQPAVYARVRLMAYVFLGFRSSHSGPDPARTTLTDIRFRLPRLDTDDRGMFRIPDVPTGDYYLQVEPSSRDQPPEGFSSVFYPGFTSVSRAESIHVAAGVETRLNPLTLTPATLGRIKVRVVDSTGQLLGQPDSQVLGDGLSLLEESTGFRKTGDPDGGFGIWSIRPNQIGKHLVCFVRLLVPPNPNGSPPVPNPSGCVPVDYTGNAMEITLNVTKPNGHLRFRLNFEDMDDASVRNFQLNVGGRMNSSTEPFICNLKSDGACSFAANPVLYAGNGILTSVSNPQFIPSDYYVQSVRQGNRDVLIDGFEIPPDADSPLDMVVSGAGGRLRGKVLNSAGEPVASSEIALVPQGTLAARSDFASTYRTTQADQNGIYEFRGLTPGDYRAYAVTDLNSFAFWDPGVTQAFRSLTSTIHVEKNSRLSADLNLIETSGN
jgi:hypothetical protein